jgi:hypothetical protein
MKITDLEESVDFTTLDTEKLFSKLKSHELSSNDHLNHDASLTSKACFTTLDTEKLFSKLKSHELSRNGRPNHDVSLTSKAFVTSIRVGGHVANPTNTTDSSALKFVLSSLAAASSEQYESIPDNEIALLVRKFRTLHRFRKERRRSPRGFFECGDTTHFIADCPKRRSSTPPISTTITTETTPVTRAMARRSIASGTITRRRS